MPKHSSKRPVFIFCNVLLTLLTLVLLTACGGGEPTVAEPTKPAATPTPTSPPAVTMKTHEGEGFTIQYPTDWTVDTQNNQTIFNAPDQKATFILTAQKNPNEALSAEALKKVVIDGLQTTSKGVKEETIESTKTINGVTWQQGAAAGEVSDSTKTANVKYVVLISNQPEKAVDTVAYMIIYGAEQDVFEENETKNIQPMLESLKIAA